MNDPLDVPELAGSDTEVEKANHFTWNLRVNVVVELFWGLALALVSTYTIVPVFLSNLGASKRLIALAPGVTLVGYALLQLPSSYFTTRIQRKTTPMIWLHVPMICAWLTAALIARDLAAERPDIARVLFVVCLGVASLTAGIGIPMWADFLNRQTPASVRGRFFGWTFATGSVTGVLGGVLARWLIGGLGFPQGFAMCFYLAAGAMLVGLLPYVLVRETLVAPMGFESARAFARHVRGILGRRRNLRRLVGVRCLMEAGIMSAAFYAVRALDVGGFSNSAAGTFTIIATAAQAPVMLLAGYVGERYGFCKVMAAGGLFGASATAIALFGGSPSWFYALFMCTGFTFACDLVSTINLVIEMSPDRDKTIYQAVYNTLLVPTRVAYPLIAGWLAESLGLAAVFRVALPLQVLGVVALLVFVRDTKGEDRRRGEAVTMPSSPLSEEAR